MIYNVESFCCNASTNTAILRTTLNYMYPNSGCYISDGGAVKI